MISSAKALRLSRTTMSYGVAYRTRLDIRRGLCRLHEFGGILDGIQACLESLVVDLPREAIPGRPEGKEME